MKLLAPIMPFITEELYHNWKEILDSEHDSIHQCEYPQSIDLDGIEIDKVTESMNLILSISKQILSIFRTETFFIQKLRKLKRNNKKIMLWK